MGGGRSGTTLLDIALGNLEGAFSLGEIHKFLKFEGIPHGAQKEDDRWAFYKKNIYSKILNDTDKDFLKIVNKTANKIEYHTSYLYTLFNLHRKAEQGSYKIFINKLFTLLFKETGKDILI
jgi:hypothetical protein